MILNKVSKINNIILPVVGMGLMVFYEACDTSCSYLQGTFASIDLKTVGICYMATLLILNLLNASRRIIPIDRLRTMMLSGALGSEAVLVHFQIVHETYCTFCLVFGLCVLILFAGHFPRMNKGLALTCFIAGVVVFAFFFKGTVLPLYL